MTLWVKETGIKHKAITGAKITVVITAYKGLIELGANLILIRLLAPAVFGSMAFAYIIISLAGMFATISSSNAIIQKKDDKIEKHIDVAFTVEFFLSIFVMVILFVMAPFIMAKLGKTDLSFFTQISALTIPITKLSFPAVIFIRELDFKRANIAPAISIPVASGITVVMALLGFGIWSFFWGAIVGSVISAIVVWKIIPYRPKIDFDSKTFKELAKFGLPLTGSALLAYYYWNVDDFMVGTMLGAEQLGYYWLAFKFPHYILNAQNSITSVVFPVFARTENNDQLRRGFEFVTKFSAITLLLPCAIVLVLGEPIIKFAFGERWLPALIPFQIFMVLVTARGIVGYWTQVLMVKERTDILFKITVQNAIVLTLLGYWLTRSYGIIGTSIAVFITIIVSLPYMTWHLKKYINVKYIKILWEGLLSFVIVLIGGLFLNMFLSNLGTYIVFLNIVLMTAIYIIFLVILLTKFFKLKINEVLDLNFDFKLKEIL